MAKYFANPASPLTDLSYDALEIMKTKPNSIFRVTKLNDIKNFFYNILKIDTQIVKTQSYFMNY